MSHTKFRYRYKAHQTWSMFLWIAVIISHTSLINGESGEEYKRILVSDPNFLQTIESKVQELTQKVEMQESKMRAMETTIASQAAQLTQSARQMGAGDVYIRWGRNVCPDTSEEVYKGYAGGSWFSHTGGAAEYICMPADPQYKPNATSSSFAYVYGAEYQTMMPSQFNTDVPCVVCRTVNASTVIMIPGRIQCYPGWTTEYEGDLAAGYYNYAAASQYVCLDNVHELVPHSENNDDGKLFFPVSSKCGSLACPPYVDFKSMACVVCSK